MIHEIHPYEYRVKYMNCAPKSKDIILFFDGDNVYCRVENGEIILPKYCEFCLSDEVRLCFLFSIGEERFFMPYTGDFCKVTCPDGYEWMGCHIFRTVKPRHLAFAVVTARQLYQWYLNNEYCGCCGGETSHSQTERACVCKQCGLIIYPKISPCVIVAVVNGEHLLLTRHKHHPHNRYSLVAGFAEIGESLEDAVRREVFEETGIHVKNIVYYKSQPWGLTSTLLSGFFCELDGNSSISIDENELSEALWVHRDDIPPAESDISLTTEMIEMFRRDKQPYDMALHL